MRFLIIFTTKLYVSVMNTCRLDENFRKAVKNYVDYISVDLWSRVVF